jgi:hypothetical protein
MNDRTRRSTKEVQTGMADIFRKPTTEGCTAVLDTGRPSEVKVGLQKNELSVRISWINR